MNGFRCRIFLLIVIVANSQMLNAQDALHETEPQLPSFAISGRKVNRDGSLNWEAFTLDLLLRKNSLDLSKKQVRTIKLELAENRNELNYYRLKPVGSRES